MCDVLDKNRESLAALIFQLGTFTKSQLIDEFRDANNGDLDIDGYQNIGALVDEMAGYGDLQKDGHFYSVVPATAFR